MFHNVRSVLDHYVNVVRRGARCWAPLPFDMLDVVVFYLYLSNLTTTTIMFYDTHIPFPNEAVLTAFVLPFVPVPKNTLGGLKTLPKPNKRTVQSFQGLTGHLNRTLHRTLEHYVLPRTYTSHFTWFSAHERTLPNRARSLPNHPLQTLTWTLTSAIL